MQKKFTREGNIGGKGLFIKASVNGFFHGHTTGKITFKPYKRVEIPILFQDGIERGFFLSSKDFDRLSAPRAGRGKMYLNNAGGVFVGDYPAGSGFVNGHDSVAQQ